MKLTRRAFVKTTAAGALLAGVPAGWRGTTYASEAPESPKVRQIVDGVHVFVGGRGGADPRVGLRVLEDVPCDELPQVLERLVRFFPRAERKEAEP